MVGTSKTERIELRVSAEDKDAIAAAAHATTTELVRTAVLDRAHHVQARSDRTPCPPSSSMRCSPRST